MRRERFSLDNLLRGAGVILILFAFGCVESKTAIKKETITQIQWETNQIIEVPTEGCFIGIWRGDYEDIAGKEKEVVDKYTADAGNPPTILNMTTIVINPLYNDFFPKDIFDAVAKNGVIPLVKYTVKPFKNFKEITEGKFDNKFVNMAIKLKEFGHPIFFGPFFEVNMDWDPKHIPFLQQPPEDFKKAYIHMHKIFTKQGAKNIIWLPTFVANFYGKEIEPYYPGDEYVDWIGFTCYNMIDKGHPSRSLASLIKPFYNSMRRFHPNKPILLCDFGRSRGGGQAEWISKAYSAIKNKFPGIKGAVWGDYFLKSFAGGKDWDSRFTEDTESLQAMRRALSDPYFLGKVYNP